ncbi:MAG: substrate-binding domain-containing protein [Clostridiales Family XIII bacterium]|jgi:ribose transport system substrate-binding protein|nr:substrate-binding domain-containing protein [Clostridiales Family XIII bacterium]
MSKRIVIAICIFLVILATFVAFYFANYRSETAKASARNNEKITVVVYGNSAERWHALEEGIIQACDEIGISRPTLLLSGQDGSDEQIRLIDRERGEGSRGIIVAADDSVVMTSYLTDIVKKTPVVTVSSGISGNVPFVGTDDTKIGEDTYDEMEIIFADASKKVLLIDCNKNRLDVRRRIDGFLAKAQADRVATADVGVLDAGTAKSIATQITYTGADAVVCFDADVMDAVVDAVDSLDGSISLYGVGIGSKSIDSLDRGITKALCFRDEFSMGYIAMMRMASAIGYKTESYPDVAMHRMIRRSSLFTEDVERLLFPKN